MSQHILCYKLRMYLQMNLQPCYWSTDAGYVLLTRSTSHPIFIRPRFTRSRTVGWFPCSPMSKSVSIRASSPCCPLLNETLHDPTDICNSVFQSFHTAIKPGNLFHGLAHLSIDFFHPLHQSIVLIFGSAGILF